MPMGGARSTTFLLLQIALRRDKQLEGVYEREAPARLRGNVCAALAAICGNGTESDSGRLAGMRSKVRQACQHEEVCSSGRMLVARLSCVLAGPRVVCVCLCVCSLTMCIYIL